MSSFIGLSLYKIHNKKVFNQAVTEAKKNDLSNDITRSSVVTGHTSPRGHNYAVKRDIERREEGKILTNLFHRVFHTVMPIGFDECYIVMEAGRCTLNRYIRHIRQSSKEEFGLSVIHKIMSQLTHYLMGLEKLRYAHLDLKTRNVVLIGNTYNQVVVIDVEGMKQIDSDYQKGYRYTLNFAPPEILFFEKSSYKIGVASDIWSLSCILFEMITREPLFNSFRNENLNSFEENLARLHQLEKVLGMPLPDAFKQEIHNSSENTYFEEKNGSLELVPIGKEIKFLPPLEERICKVLPEEKAREYIPLILGMLVIDPNKRMTIEAVHEVFIKNMMVVSLRITESVLQMREKFSLRFYQSGSLINKHYISGIKPLDCIHFPKDAESNEPLMLKLYLRRYKNDESYWHRIARKEASAQKLDGIIIDRDRDREGDYKILLT